MWSRLPPRFVARMLSSHTVVGLAASVLLYILCLSGTVMVFHEEFQRWEQPGVPEFARAEPEVVHLAAENGLARVEHAHHFYIGMPVPDFPRMTVTTDERAWYANERGELVAEIRNPWRDFLEKLHYYLTLPSVLGITLVGVLGVLMTALAISGIFAHPKLFRDAFKLRLRGNARLRETDTHNRFGVWATPFHIVIAFTGAALGLATLGAYVIGSTAGEGGDIEAFFAPIFGAEEDGDETPAPLSNITAALKNFERVYPQLRAWYVSFHDPATLGQVAEILAQHPRRVVYGDNYYFDADGQLTGNTGLSDGEIGQQIAASLYPLHFGSFGGLPVKLAYAVLGLLACVVVASGINIWLLKRRQRGRAAVRLERAWIATVWGAPFAMALVMLITQLNVEAMNALVATFWIAQLGVMVIAMFSTALTGERFKLATGMLLSAVLVLHVTQHYDAMHSPAAWGVNAGLVCVAAWMLWQGRRALPLRASTPSKVSYAEK